MNNKLKKTYFFYGVWKFYGEIYHFGRNRRQYVCIFINDLVDFSMQHLKKSVPSQPHRLSFSQKDIIAHMQGRGIVSNRNENINKSEAQEFTQTNQHWHTYIGFT